jgi:hypothetical protein
MNLIVAYLKYLMFYHLSMEAEKNLKKRKPVNP